MCGMGNVFTYHSTGFPELDELMREPQPLIFIMELISVGLQRNMHTLHLQPNHAILLLNLQKISSCCTNHSRPRQLWENHCCFLSSSKLNRISYSTALSICLSFFCTVWWLLPVFSCSGRWAILLLSWVLAYGEGWEDTACAYPSLPRQHSCPGKMLPWSIWEIQGSCAAVTHHSVKGNVTIKF